MSKVIGGYIPGTNSMRMHPIKNILVKSDFISAKIRIFNENYKENHPEYKQKNISIEINNKEKENLFEIKMNNDYKLDLYHNNYKIYSDNYLYYYEISFDSKIDNIELKDGMIYDC